MQFLKKAVDILCQCRQTLMYTYVFAYYLKKNNQSMIFEDNQKDLESATEKLSEYLERDITSENLADIKQKVQDKYRYYFWYTILKSWIYKYIYKYGIADIVRSDAQCCSIMCTKDMKRIGGTIQNDASPGWIIKAEECRRIGV